MNTETKKTVFFLGAGFSCAAGAPSQRQLMGKVLNYDGDNYGNPVDEYKEDLKKFLKDAFSLEENQMINFNLEDFYTPIDKCISENLSFRGYSINKIKKIKNRLSTLISIVIDWELTTSEKDDSYINEFIKIILDHKRIDSSTDHVSIITTNWDILLDRRFYIELKEGGNKGALDYGTMVVSSKTGRSNPLTPPLVAITRGMYTIKLLKIHGSLNWLKCPSCNRLFVNPESKIGITEYDLNFECSYCVKIYSLVDDDYGLDLEPQIIYPTFLKDFSNIHFNQVWDSAANELTEATRIIFMGYSFQQADYEIRQLLSRKVPDNCEIICVTNKSKSMVLRRKEKDEFLESRYRNFFGRRNITFDYCGVREFINNKMPAINFTT